MSESTPTLKVHKYVPAVHWDLVREVPIKYGWCYCCGLRFTETNAHVGEVTLALPKGNVRFELSGM